jgi:hypothetical protein
MELRKRMLETAGFAVLATSKPHNALKMLRENSIDLVLTEQIPDTRTESFILAAMKALRPDVPIAIPLVQPWRTED